MKENTTLWLNIVFKISLVLVIFSSLFLFWGLTTDFYELPKLLVLIIFTAAMLILTAVKYMMNDKVSFIRTPLDLPLVLLLFVAVVSTVISPAPLISIFGNQPTPHGGLASLVVYILFYFLLVNNLKGFRDAKFVVTILTISGAVLSLIILASYFGLKFLPAPWVQAANFNTVGSLFSLTAILALLLPFTLLSILTEHNNPIYKVTIKTVQAVLLTLFGMTLVLTGSLASWVAAALGVGLVALLVNPKVLVKNLPFLAAPLAIVALVAILSYLPIPQFNNPLYTKAQALPRELQLDFLTSWKVSVSTFRDTPFFGTGPDTYLFNFTAYKPIEFNNTKLWNVRFDTPFNEYLGFLANLGGLGLLALLLVTALFLPSAIATLLAGRKVEPTADSLKLGLAISGILLFVLLALHASTLPLWVVGLLLLASYMVSSPHLSKPAVLGLGGLSPQFENLNFDALPSLFLVAILALVGASAFFGTKYVLADIHHRNALNAVSQNNGILAYNELIESEKLAPWNDLYRSDLAQTNFALANAIAATKGPSQASPSGSLTDQDKANIQTLLSQAITEGKTSTNLNPRSTGNWEILAILYRQIAGVAENALIYSLDSYGKAIQRDPYNPILRLNVGGVYYAVKNFDLAIRFFTDSVNLKPDYANAYYNLSVALRDKNDLPNAIAMAEKVVSLVDKNSPDYKVASDYLNDLKSKQNQIQAEPPAARQTGSALEKKELPKVLDLQKPESIATPAAIKKPSPTPSPQP